MQLIKQPLKFSIDALAESLISDFKRLTGIFWETPLDLLKELNKIIQALTNDDLRNVSVRRENLHAIINDKLGLCQATYKTIINTCAANQVFFNYHEKTSIQRALNYNDRNAFNQTLKKQLMSSDIRNVILNAFESPTWELSRGALQSLKNDDDRAEVVYRSIFSAYIFCSFKTEAIHKYFSRNTSETYYVQFYDYIRNSIPRAFVRECGLIYIKIDEELLSACNSYQEKRNVILNFIKKYYEKLSNHCYFAFLLKFTDLEEDIKWRLYSDIVLYAEKFQSVKLKTGYFKPEKIAAQTKAYIDNLDIDACKFELANQGLFYKDCFVVTYKQTSFENQESSPDLLLLFEKNERDETPIPCPACRSGNVQGNSYPILGVRSWECKNIICPERSKYDRGNRYSLASLLRQESIEEEEAIIPTSSLRLWKRDLVNLSSESAILEMLVRHYSLLNDRILLINNLPSEALLFGRQLINENSITINKKGLDVNSFFEGHYFKRICVDKTKPNNINLNNLSSHNNIEIYCEDCFNVLTNLESDSIDSIITSPPYYNARTYSSYPNIYCFLYEQYNIGKEIFRVLKPGSLFLYNIFDYFDNENNIVFSAMGKKRMILGAYAINLFTMIGFNFVKNVVWDKGEIEGKRNFNQGNRSPYYQAPFNCWEHIFVFSKEKSNAKINLLPHILQSPPVIKMLHGQNILGHTAPFPEAIPNLLLNLLDEKAIVLDPFAGSMTTSRAANKRNIRSISIDYMSEYCDLGDKLLKTESQTTLL